MKKQLLVLIMVLTFSFQGKGQWVSIPDTNFGTWLYLRYPTCIQGNNTLGWQIDTTCNAILNVTYLDCSNSNVNDPNGIQYFDNLLEFDCNNNQIINFTSLPKSLTTLYCNASHLSALPSLPNSLTSLHCSINQLTTLPDLPDGLLYLYCERNHIASFPTLPNTLNTIICETNQLTTLPELPDSLFILSCYDNLLQCFPRLKKVVNFYYSNTGLTCLPNYPLANTISSPSLSSIPLCDSLNNNGCPFCYAHFSIHPDSANAGVYYGYNQSAGTNLTSYLWEFGDGDTSSLQFPSHTYAQAGQYNVCLTVSSPNCTNTFCDSSFLVFKTEGGLMNQLNIIDASTGIPHTGFPSPHFSLSPNPATHQVNIQVDESMATGFVSVTDVTGQTVMQFQLSATQTNLSTQHLPDGIYLITLQHQGQRSTQKLVITQY